ncbi:MAG TPA: FxLYD domain-containing protein [Polyangium sp.]|nr:FxLYD domain-containing protein [Polyangium sp.]
MMQQPSGEPQMAQGYPPGGGAPPPGGAGFSGGGPDGGGYGGPPGGFGGGAPPGGFGGGAPPGGYGGPPGGYGGPPGGGGPPPGGFGGAPPGGFGGPPGGGAPPDGFGGGGQPPGGGGYGGPPQGGGGYGGPPQGGFGGPPQGGFGGPQQGGYGGPPMGAPMGGPPQKKSNVGMIIGIGCAGIFILLCGAIGFSCWWAQKKAKETAAAIASAFPIDSTGKLAGDPFDLKPPTDGSLKLDIKDVRWFNASSMVSVVAEIENTGTAPVSYPSVKFTFYDGSKTAIDSGTCSGTLSELGPGERVPCSFFVTKVKSWDSYKTESTPMKVYGLRKPAKLKITDTKFTPKKGWTPNKLEGKITNESAFKAKHITAVVGLYDKDGKVCGTGFASVSGNELDPGTATTFSASIFETATPPDTFKVIAMGTGD